MTRARTRSGRSLAMAWAIRLPMSYPATTRRPSPSSPISAMRLRAWAAAVYWPACGRVLIGLAEAPQVGHDHLGRRCHQGRGLPVVGAVPRPAVQQQDRRLPGGPGTVVGQPEPVDLGVLAHNGCSRAAA